MEFLYYGSVLKVVAPTLSSDPDKLLVTPWITKLFRPGVPNHQAEGEEEQIFDLLDNQLAQRRGDGSLSESSPGRRFGRFEINLSGTFCGGRMGDGPHVARESSVPTG
jgi:hypothetical protein